MLYKDNLIRIHACALQCFGAQAYSLPADQPAPSRRFITAMAGRKTKG